MRKRSKKVKSRIIRTFHPETISIPEFELVRVLEGSLVYSRVIDGDTDDVLGIADMAVVRETMRPVKDPACSEEGEYYIANWRK